MNWAACTTFIVLAMVSNAFAVGILESGMWYDLTPQEEIDAHFDDLSTMELCNSWKAVADDDGRKGDKARISIGAALERKGESAFLCQQMGFGN